MTNESSSQQSSEVPMIDQYKVTKAEVATFSVKHALIPIACLIALCGAMALSIRTPNVLSADSGKVPVDLDNDGIVYQQEELLGTSDSFVDTDRDGYSDLEELARSSDPTGINATPGSKRFGTAVYAYSDNGILTFQVAVYVRNSDITNLSLEAGFVSKSGQTFVFGPDVLDQATYTYRTPMDPNDLLLVMALPIPESFLSKQRQFNLFARIKDLSLAGQSGGAGGANSGSVGTLTVVASGGVMFQMQTPPISVMEGDGVIYRPLTSPDDAPPSGSNSGQVCWQSLAPSASNGSLIQFSVQSSSCQDFDAYCDATACSSSFGSNVQMIDPASLLGG